ncbi:MAG: hypothetical protein PUB22_05225 [Clostridiales bacterium]|nr:hypothetical protein [Clostridiales bacterium]
MIVEERYGNQVNAEVFSVEVKRGYLYCSPERSNLLYLIGRSTYVNKNGKECHTSEVLMREAFSAQKLEEFLDKKDQLKLQQEEINLKVVRMMNGSTDPQLARKIKLDNGWALKEADE